MMFQSMVHKFFSSYKKQMIHGDIFNLFSKMFSIKAYQIQGHNHKDGTEYTIFVYHGGSNQKFKLQAYDPHALKHLDTLSIEECRLDGTNGVPTSDLTDLNPYRVIQILLGKSNLFR